MEFDNRFSNINSREQELAMSRSLPLLMRKVYTWMTMALIITGVVAYGVGTSEALLMAIFNNSIVFFGLMIAELALVFYLSARIHKLSLPSATIGFIAFSVINGLTLGSIFAVYRIGSIAQTFFVTAGTFSAMAFIGYTTKKDLSNIGGYLLMALFGLIIAGMVNIFLKSSMFDFILSGLIVLVFTGLTAWDVQTIKKMLMHAPDAGESAQKIALLGALNLYLDFINLFIHLLRFFGSRD